MCAKVVNSRFMWIYESGQASIHDVSKEDGEKNYAINILRINLPAYPTPSVQPRVSNKKDFKLQVVIHNSLEQTNKQYIILMIYKLYSLDIILEYNINKIVITVLIIKTTKTIYIVDLVRHLKR